jgi:hypothetical protein
MAVFNGDRFLSDAVRSVLDQSWRDLEFIIVDDGSTDRTPAMLREFEAADPRVRVISQKNQGFVAALNVGCGAAEAPFIARMDADDVSTPERLMQQMDFLRRHPEVDVVSGAMIRCTSELRPIKRMVTPATDTEIKAALRSYNCIYHPAVVMRRAAFLETGGYRRAFRHVEDYDLWLRMAERFTFAGMEEVCLLYRVHDGQVSIANLYEQVLAMFAARIASRQRSERGSDGFDGPVELTPALLEQHGLDPTAIDAELQRQYERTARIRYETGGYSEAVAMLRRPLPGARGPIVLAQALEALHRREARRRIGSMQLLSAIRPVASVLRGLVRRHVAQRAG